MGSSSRISKIHIGFVGVRTPGCHLDNTRKRLYTSLMNYRDYITIDPNKRGGKPCVRGLRITVYEVLDYLASDMSESEILEDFPDLTKEDLKACIAFAAERERRLVTVPPAA